jgi:protein O-mannosyl-transferase
MKRLAPWQIALGCVILSLLAFLPILGSTFVNDDLVLIYRVATRGPFGNFTVPHTDYFRPFVSLLFWASWKVFGLSPVGYHVLNAIANGFCGFVVWLLLGRIVPEQSASRLTNWPAWRLAAAGAFIILPSHLEPVSWGAGASDLWMSLFALLSLYYFVGGLTRSKDFITAFVLFAVAACFKETALALILVAPILAIVVGGTSNSRRIAIAAIPLVVIAVAAFFMRTHVVGSALSGAPEASLLQAAKPAKVVGNFVDYPLRTLTGGLPLDRLFNQPYSTNSFAVAGSVIKHHVALAGLGAALILAALFALVRGVMGAGQLKLFSALGFGFYASCGPTLALYVSAVSCQNERYLYLPSAFLVMALALGLATVKRQALAASFTVLVSLGTVISLFGVEADWRRASDLTRAVYDRLPELNGIAADNKKSVLIVANAPDALRGYPMAGNCLHEALHMLQPGSTPTIVILSRQDQITTDVEAAIAGNNLTLGSGGFIGSVKVAVPAGPASLPDRFHFLQVNDSSYSYEANLAPNEMLVVFSNGHFLAAKP